MATKLLRQTKNLKMVQKALNHADLKTTARYAHVLDEDVAEAIGFFAGPRSAKSTGNVVNVDGGVTAAYPR